MLKRQKADDTLQQEVMEISNLRVLETSTTLTKQKEHDCRIADLTSTISHLETSISQQHYRGIVVMVVSVVMAMASVVQALVARMEVEQMEMMQASEISIQLL